MSADATNGDRKGRRRNGKIRVIVRRSMDNARQWMHPVPFRIKESPDLVAISKDVLLGQEAAPAARPTGQAMDADFKHVLKTIAAVATALWRVRTKLEAESKVVLPSELRHLPRHIESAWDALAAGGFEVQDHKGQLYVPGMAVNPVTYTPDPSVPPNTIVESLKPSLFWKDLLIQRADVILAAPADGSSNTRHRDALPPSPDSVPKQPDIIESPIQSTT
jgi:hypothetical protein